MSVYTYVPVTPGALRCPQKPLDLVVSPLMWVLRTKLCSSAKAARALNRRASSPVPVTEAVELNNSTLTDRLITDEFDQRAVERICELECKQGKREFRQSRESARVCKMQLEWKQWLQLDAQKQEGEEHMNNSVGRCRD